MLHAHVEALLYHRVLIRDVGSRPHLVVGAALLVISIRSFSLKSPFTGVEDNRILQVLRSGLAVSLGPRLCRPVLARTRNLKFQALSVENIVVSESRGCGIKTHSFSSERFIVPSPCLLSPVWALG